MPSLRYDTKLIGVGNGFIRSAFSLFELTVKRTRIKLVKAFEKFLYALNVLSYSALYVAFEIHRHNGVMNA